MIFFLSVYSKNRTVLYLNIKPASNILLCTVGNSLCMGRKIPCILWICKSCVSFSFNLAWPVIPAKQKCLLTTDLGVEVKTCAFSLSIADALLKLYILLLYYLLYLWHIPSFCITLLYSKILLGKQCCSFSIPWKLFSNRCNSHMLLFAVQIVSFRIL